MSRRSSRSHPTRTPRPQWLLAGAVAIAACEAFLIVHLVRVPPASSQPVKQALSITTRLPAWQATGVPLVVHGYGGVAVRLALRASGRTVATGRTDGQGRYTLRFTPTKPGRYTLAVVGGLSREGVGTLVVRPVVIEAVGDITFGEQVGQYGARYPWTNVAATLRTADITVGNLETSVSTRGIAADKQYVFRGSPSSLVPLARQAGFDVLTLANNHSVDYGRDALVDTVRSVHAAGIQPIGAGVDERRARLPAIVDAGGLRVAFLGYSDVNPLGFPAGPTTAGTARADTAAIATDVHAALRRSDVVVCYFHWGTELHPEPDARQMQFAAACLQAGASVVLGAHPHVFGPVRRPTSATLVAWSLGNFVFPSSGVTARTAILHVNVDRRGVRGFRLLPVAIEGFRPRLISP
jgi:poly-gamma-glutamate capsule biosynthesis protein CapA/YwtB (metallophosphatase superfamily)